MKRLALITPKGVFFSVDSELPRLFENIHAGTANDLLMPKYAFWSGGSLGLLIVASLTPTNFEVNYIDENHEEINFSIPYDIVAISGMTQQATRMYEIADEFRRRGVMVVIGGIHATVLPDEAKMHADSVMVGEAENTWPDFMADFINGCIRPQYVSSEPADLTKAPIPRYELLKKYDYRMIWVQTTRGCPHSCEFCCASNVYGKTYRRKTIEQVFQEINYIRSIWKEPLINFADDNMFVDRMYSSELLKRLAQTGLRWTAQTDVSVSQDDVLLELLQKSRCAILFIGFETLEKSNKIDAHGWKQNKIQGYPEAIKKIQAKGIGVLGAFIVGLDEDDISVFDHLSDFIISNRLYAAQITVLTPLPGTTLRKRLLNDNRISSSEWRRYTFWDVNFIPQKMTSKELQSGLIRTYKRIYSKEARLSVIKHFKEIYAGLH